jgi:hypothetical protein
MDWSDEDLALLEAAGATVCDEEAGEGIAQAIVEQAFPWAGILAPFVLVDEHTSNFPALVRAGPIAGYVVHFRHDDQPVVLCRSVEYYLDAVRRTGELPTESLLDPDGERTELEERAAQHLVANAFDEDDWAALALAIPLIRANLGLLVQLSSDEDVGDEALQRLKRVAPREVLAAIEAGQPPEPWPIPAEMRPTVEVELPGWSRGQMGFGEAVLSGPVAVERDGETRILVLHHRTDLTAFLDEAIPAEPDGLSFLEAVGRWGEGVPVAVLRWYTTDHVRLTVGEEQLFDWTKG